MANEMKKQLTAKQYVRWLVRNGNLTLREVAKKAGVSTRTVRRYLRDGRDLTSKLWKESKARR
jgi:DNA-binding transcriptional regulator LsrR (DeoR family)